MYVGIRENPAKHPTEVRMENGTKVVPYIVHEAEVARQERHIKRMWILCIIMFLALVGTNAGWILHESQFEDIAMTQEAVADDGSNAVINGTATGDINYGEGQTDNQSTAQENGR